VTFKKCVSAIDEIKYSPNNRLLATGSHDLYIDIYDTGFRGPGGDKKKSGKVLKYPEVRPARCCSPCRRMPCRTQTLGLADIARQPRRTMPCHSSNEAHIFCIG